LFQGYFGHKPFKRLNPNNKKGGFTGTLVPILPTLSRIL